MIYAIHIALGLGLSFVGSLPFGTINLTTAETAIQKGLKAALWVAFGASLVEFFQAAFSLKFSSLITDNPFFTQILMWASIPVFFGIGLYFLCKTNPPPASNDTRGSGKAGFFKGVIISALNILAIPYWVFYASYLASNDLIQLQNTLCIILFSGGVVAGTFLVLFAYAKLGSVIRRKADRIHRYASSGVGMVFILIAIVQLVRILL